VPPERQARDATRVDLCVDLRSRFGPQIMLSGSNKYFP
jgi:hypothetical protein